MDEGTATLPDDDRNLTRLRRVFWGMLFIALAFGFAVLYLNATRKIANVKSHLPVTATITSKTETKGKYYYTRVIIDYWRETARGPEHCSVPKNLPDWSSDYDVGKTIKVFPKEESCYEPYTVGPDEGSPTMLIVSAIAFLLLGGLSIWKAYRA